VRPPPRLYIITDRRATGGRSLVEVVAEALEGARGAEDAVAVQLREKDLPSRDLLDLARALRAVTAAARVRLFVNDRIEVALASHADGVHLGNGSLSIAQTRGIAPGLAVSLSTHTDVEVRAAANAGVEFVVYGPVFETPSKSGVLRPTGTAALSTVCGFGVPVLALGGIDTKNAASCLAAGAAGVACIRFVISATNSAQRVGALLACKPPIET
jgi:thiamine-phosphate pyrophosphorylase